jgi:segregation and condensation protein B
MSMSEDEEDRDAGLDEDLLDEDESDTDEQDEKDHEPTNDKEPDEALSEHTEPEDVDSSSIPSQNKPEEGGGSTIPGQSEPVENVTIDAETATPDVPETEAGENKDIFIMPDFEIEEGDILDEIKPAVTDQEKEEGVLEPGEANLSAKGKEKSADDVKSEFTRNQIEAVLFVSGQPVSAEEIAVKLSIPKKTCEELLDKLALQYIERSSALEIAKIGDKYILQLKPEYTSSVKSFASGGLIREAVMRTLTVIAAKQPILQSDLAKIRSAAGEHLKELTEMGLVKASPKGRSKELVTTDKFADMFGFSRDVSKMKEQIKLYLTDATKDDNE